MKKTFIGIIAILILAGIFGFGGYRLLKTAADYTKDLVDKEFGQLTASIDALGNHIDEETLIIDSLTGTRLVIHVNDLELPLDLGKSNVHIQAPTLYADAENTITFTSPDETVKVYFNDALLQQEQKFSLAHLRKADTIPLTITNGRDSRTYMLETLPNDFPSFELIGASAAPGEYYGDFLTDPSFIYKMGEGGEILFYRRNTSSQGDLMNFKKIVINGQTYYGFFEPAEAVEGRDQAGINYGEIVILDARYQEMDRLRLLPSKKIPSGDWVENHDFIMLAEGHYLLTGAVDQLVQLDGCPVGAHVKAACIQEIVNGEVVFEWLSTDEPALLAASVENNDYTGAQKKAADYAHINSICIDPKDHHLIVSMRNTDSVEKIDRKTGERIWVLGGKQDMFGLDETQLFSRQHHACLLSDGSLTIFDNGNAKNQSRVIRVMLDEETKQLVSYQAFEIPGLFAPACGSAQCVNEEDNVFVIGCGMNAGQAAMMEIDFSTGTVLKKLIIGSPGPYLSTYRCQKFQ